MTPIIEVNNLSKQFKNIIAVDNLSFKVSEGDVFGFLGQNGAGKSTTIRMLLTLIEPTEGDIKIFGLDLKKHRKEILRNIGAVIEKPDVYSYLTGLENLRLFSRLSGGARIPDSNLMEQLQKVGLEDRAHHKVKSYSMGMKQRLGIAIALAHDPKLIVLDEPTNGLDPQGISDVRNLILHLSHNLNKTILVSSHLLNEIELISNRLLIIDKGRKLVTGKASELFDPGKTIIEINTTDNFTTMQFLRNTEWNAYMDEKPGKNIVFKMSVNKIPFLNQSLVRNNIEVLSIEPRHSLEDYFLKLTTGKQYVETFVN